MDLPCEGAARAVAAERGGGGRRCIGGSRRLRLLPSAAAAPAEAKGEVDALLKAGHERRV